MTTATFAKLLEVSMVASKRSESSFKERILRSEKRLLSFIASTSAGDKEKKAISAADTMAETPKSNTANTKTTTAPVSGE